MAKAVSIASSSSGLSVELTGISKAFGRSVALRSVDVCVGWGRILVLFGHNGAGKSTLLRIMATLTRPEEGRIAVGGFSQPSTIRRSIGYVGHQNLLYQDLTAAENLRFYGHLHGMRETDTAVTQVLNDVGVSAWADRRINTLSNGMQKRVAIARALLHKPSVLLLDEPDAGLDLEARDLVDTVVRAVAAGGGTVVLATHEVNRGLAVADDYILLRDGRVSASGLVAETSSLDLVEVLSGRGRQ